MEEGRSKRGFASMSKEKLKEVSSKGGKSSGGQEKEGRSKKGFASMPRERVQEIGRKGGKSRAKKKE